MGVKGANGVRSRKPEWQRTGNRGVHRAQMLRWGRSGMEALILIVALLVCLCIVLPIVAFVRTNRIRTLELRLAGVEAALDRKSTRLNSSHLGISYAVFCL